MHSPKKRHQSYTLLYAETAGGEHRRSNKKKSIPKQELKNGLGRGDGPTSSYIEKKQTHQQDMQHNRTQELTRRGEAGQRLRTLGWDWVGSVQTTADPLPLPAD